MRDNQHLGKISILVGAEKEGLGKTADGRGRDRRGGRRVSDGEGIAVEINWVANPFRGDKFEEAWLPVAEAALDYGATGWALFRNTDGLLDFTQYAFFPTKLDFDRYWYSEEVAEAREEIAGWYLVPLVPTVPHDGREGSLSRGSGAGSGAVGPLRRALRRP